MATTLKDLLKTYTVEGDLCEKMEGDRLRCVACGHRCVILPGLDGICRVRYNEGGRLMVPAGYVGALQCDPTEKKPFFHAYPGSRALTFGMLGCDLHCSYCFPGNTIIITNRGPMSLSDAFASAPRVDHLPDAEIAYPSGLQAVAASGTFREVRAVFKHPYRGELTVIRPYYLPELCCTPDHRVYATDDAAVEPQPLEARHLTDKHYLAIPRSHTPALVYSQQGITARLVVETESLSLIPIRNVSSKEYKGDVYNLEVEEEHNYLAGFFLVKNCQNWVTSQALRDKEAIAPPMDASPDDLTRLARRKGARLLVSSYNEPLITSEWAVEIFKRAKPAGFVCGYVSNGNATPEVLDYIRPWVDLYKIDLKSFNDRNYRKLGGLLSNVLNTIKMVHERGFWLEIVSLLIPGFNDAADELKAMAEFVAGVSPDIPWHVTAFHKDYKMTGPDNTPVETLLRAAEIGRQAGLRFVYAGNLPGRVGQWEHTRCPNCQATLIERYGFRVLSNRIKDGACPACGTAIPGRWN